MYKFIGKSNERILCKLSKSEILRLYSIVHVAMETTKTWDFTCQSKSFISISVTCQVSACQLKPFSCHDLANGLYSQTDKTVFSHLKLPPFLQWGIYQSLCTCFQKDKWNRLPHYLNTSLRKISDNHTRITRNCNLNLLSPPHPSTKTAQKGEAPLQWELLRTGITYPEPWELRRLWHPSSQNYGKYC